MKKLPAALLAVAALLSFAWAGVANASSSFHTGTNVNLTDDTIDSTVFAAGNTVDISSDVDGDIFCAGQTINISGTVRGDVICAGQTVTISGMVDGDVRLAGQSITIGAEVSGNATLAGQSFTLQSDGEVKGDVTIGSASANINGDIGRDLAVGGNDVTVAGMIGRDITGDVTNLNLSSSADVQGDIEYTSVNEINREDGAQVAGEIIRNELAEQGGNRGALFGFTVMWFFYLLIAMLLVAMVIVALFPRAVHAITNQAMPRPWKALLVGFIASVSFPILTVLLAITIVGIPLAILVGLSWFVIAFISGPLFGYYLGRMILPKTNHALKIMLLGSSVLIVLYFIPIIGFIAMLAAFWIGIGMTLLEIFARASKPNYNVPKS